MNRRNQKRMSPVLIILFIVSLALAVVVALVLPDSVAAYRFSIGAVLFVVFAFISVAIYRQRMKKSQRR